MFLSRFPRLVFLGDEIFVGKFPNPPKKRVWFIGIFNGISQEIQVGSGNPGW